MVSLRRLGVLHIGGRTLKINWTYATKAIASLAGTAYTLLAQYPHVTWQEIAVGLLTAGMVWLVPNTTKQTTPTISVVSPNMPVIPVTEMTNADRAELERLRAQQ